MVSGNLVIKILGSHNENYLPGAETIAVYPALKLVVPNVFYKRSGYASLKSEEESRNCFPTAV